MSEEANDISRPKKITRSRPFLSCVQCIKRKVKCDRNVPCSACTSRKKPDECVFPLDPDRTQTRRPFQSDSESLQSSPTNPLVTVQNKRKRSDQTKTQIDEQRPGFAHSIHRQGEIVNQTLSSAEARGDRNDARYTENAVKDMEDYLTAGAMSRKWTISAQGAEGVGYSTFPLPEGVIERLTSQKCIPTHLESYQKVLNTLPNQKEAIHCLVARYFSNVAWHWHILHRQSFLEEYEAFGILFDRGEIAQVDPLWIANLFAVLTLAANSFDEVDDITGMFFNATDLAVLPDKYFRAAGSALECGDWLGKARIRSIQALSLLGTYLLFNAAPDCVERIGMYCITSMRMCQELGIHILLDDPTKMPLPDPSFPQQHSTLKREIVLRLFYNCLTLDLLQHRHKPFMDLQDITCGLPVNYNDDQLNFNDDSVPRPEPTLTETAIDILRFESARLQREWLNTVRRDKTPSDEVLLDIDKRIVQVHNHYDLGRIDLQENRQRTWSKLISVYNLHVRRMRFHRPFLRLDDQSTSQIQLRKAVDQAARGLMSAALELFRLGAPLTRGSFFLLHLQSAVIVLIQNAWHIFDSTTNTDDELISNVLAIFQHYRTSLRDQVRRAARIGTSTITSLIEVINDRRSFAGSHESFVHALRRISDAVKREDRAQADLQTLSSAVTTESSQEMLFSDQALEAWMLSFMNDGQTQIWDTGPSYTEGNL